MGCLEGKKPLPQARTGKKRTSNENERQKKQLEARTLARRRYFKKSQKCRGYAKNEMYFMKRRKLQP